MVILLKYFYGPLKHLHNVNLFARSIREASFDLFVTSPEALCPLLFALDHVRFYIYILIH